MKIKRILLITAVAVLCTVSLVRAEETKANGNTAVGYTSSTVVKIPGGNDSIKTGDYIDIGKMLVLFGSSASIIIFLALHKGKKEGRRRRGSTP